MNSWDAIFLKGRFTSEYPQAEVAKFVSFAEKRFEGEQLKCWDHCCGAGRHTLMLASRGHKVFASDASRVALDILENRLKEKGLNAEVKIADMCECPWNEEFHIVISWDAIHHNKIENIRKALDVIYAHLRRNGLFIATLKSNKAENFGLGEFIEKNTYTIPKGVEKGIMHHYFDEEEIKELFSKWKILLLVEQVSREVIADASLFEQHIFPSTKWGIIAQK